MKHTEKPLAREIVEKTTAQVKILTGRQWPEINRILEKDGEIKLDIPGGWQLKGLRTEFRVKAKMAKWPQASINAFLEIIKNCDTVDKLKETLRPHVIETTKEPQNA